MSLRTVALASLVLAASALTGCAGPSPREGAAGAAPPTAAAASRRHASRQPGNGAGDAANGASTAPLPDTTGIPACDDYLASYKACHRAAHIFTRGSLEQHYEMMRTSLLRQSMDPQIRKTLPERCRSLSRLLHQALHGKSCDMPSVGS